MSWFKRVTDLLRHEAVAPAPKVPMAVSLADEPAPVTPEQPAAPATPKAAKPTSRPAAALLVAQAAAAKAAAEALRREQAAASARQILASMGVQLPTPPRPAAAPTAAPSAILSPERKALISDAMRHWAHGHAIYERLDPGLKERVRAIAERMAPK
jgi:hypothetical protein